MITLLKVAPFSRMKTALSLPVSASVSQALPRSYSLFPMSFEPEMTLGLASETIEPTRVGMFNV